MMGRLLFRLTFRLGLTISAGISFLCISGCAVVKQVDQEDPFRRLYNSERREVSRASEAAPAVYLTLSAYQMPLSTFCRVLSDKYKIGMVFADSLGEKQITAEFKETDLQSVLNVVSRQIGVDIVRVGNSYFIGNLRPEDRGVLVRRVLGYDASALSPIVTALLSQNGKASVMPNGVVVATDHESVLRRMSEMFDYLDTVDPGCWIVQLYFVALRKDRMIEAGFDMKSSGSISYDIQSSTVAIDDLDIEGMFNVGADASFTDVFAAPMLVIRDGSLGSWTDGERVPIPRKTVSNEGTVSTTGFDYVDTGFLLTATVRESRRGGFLKLDIKQSQIKSYVEYSPVTAETALQLEADLIPEKIYLLGELNTFKQIDALENTTMLNQESGKTSMQIWCKLFRVGSPIKSDYPRQDRFSAAPTGAPEKRSPQGKGEGALEKVL